MFVIYYSLWFSIVGLLLKSCSLLNFTLFAEDYSFPIVFSLGLSLSFDNSF